MAKPRPVEGLDPDDRLLPNARRVLAVRIDEVYAYDTAVRDPAHVKDLHDMRIACKRLRYVLEIFGIAFDADLEPELDQIKVLQDLLGDIHDCDVMLARIEHSRAAEPEGFDALAARFRADRALAFARFAALWSQIEACRLRDRLLATTFCLPAQETVSA